MIELNQKMFVVIILATLLAVVGFCPTELLAQNDDGSQSGDESDTCLEVRSRGWVKVFSAKAADFWVQMADTNVQLKQLGSGFLLVDELTDTSSPYNWCSDQQAVFSQVFWYYRDADANYDWSEWTDGVNGHDLLRVQRHILDIEPITTIREYIAADANLDGRVDSEDFVELQRLILGLSDELPQGSSYRNQPFVYVIDVDYNGFEEEEEEMLEGDYSFLELFLPFQYASIPTVGVVEPGQPIPIVEANAFAIKRGDVDGSWTPDP